MAVLRSVAKTDTFDIFRQKVNQIAEDVFDIESGNIDLSTGNLRLGDGTTLDPSLAFESDPNLGIYKAGQKTIGFVSGGKKIANYSETLIYSFKDLIFQKSTLKSTGISLLNSGQNYDVGSYSAVKLLGGTGDGATANITVSAYTGQVTNSGQGYSEGSYSDVLLDGGSGIGATASFTVDQDGVIENFQITSTGTGYQINDVLSLPEDEFSEATIDFQYTITKLGSIQSFSIVSLGTGYSVNDLLTVNNKDLTKPLIYPVISRNLQKLFVGAEISDTTFSVGDTITIIDLEENVVSSSVIYEVKSTEGFVDSLLINYDPDITSAESISFEGQIYDLISASAPLSRFFINSGSGFKYVPDFVLYVGNTYTFDLSDSSNLTHLFTFSATPEGTPYTDGVIRTSTSLTITVTELTPNLYYYCSLEGADHDDEGGEEDNEFLLIVDFNNPKIFGSGLSLKVNEVITSDVITGDVETGSFTALSFNGTQATFGSASITGVLTAPSITGNNITATNISSASNLDLAATAVNITGNFNIGSTIQAVSSSGNITTSGTLRTNGTLSVSGVLNVTNNIISSASNNDIELSPSSGRIAKISTNTALIIPSGSSAQRPTSSLAQNGAVRFNTDSNQYEGYSAATSTWSSLGGVRDLDGNTYIAAEAFAGANDNILYFYNDSNNTLKLSRDYLDFNTVKKLRSLDPTLPTYSEWSANTPVTEGDYLKYRNNIYLVTTTGVTATVTNEPTHTTGSQSNGSTVLEWYSSAVAPLIFEEIQELQVGPLGNLPLVINGDLRLAGNTLSTDISDLIIKPNFGRRVTIDSPTSLVIPSGDSNSRGVAARGSIRYNTSITQFEGYNGANWTSLGGVKDVDGNTYIIPETSPGSNENILYFYNDDDNTLQVSTTSLRFESISSITSASNTLAINTQLVTFDNLSASIDNSGTRTFFSSTQDNLDIGLSVGLINNHLIRLNVNGDIIVNKGFGTSFDDNITVLTNELKDFELDDTKISSADIILVKGLNDSGSTILYSPSTATGSKVVFSANNSNTNDIEMSEFNVINKGEDIYYSEYGNIITEQDLVTISFDFDSLNNVRMNFSLNDSVSTGDELKITVIKTIIKK
jgi:hypothetical protein